MRLVCAHCGLPFSGSGRALGAEGVPRPVYCCSGCALAARLGRREGREEVGREVSPGVVGAAVGLVFLGLNQAVAWLLAFAPGRGTAAALGGPGGGGGAAVVAWLPMISLGLGGAFGIGLTVVQARLGARRGADAAVAAVVGLVHAAGWATVSPSCVLVANAAFAAWALRGLVLKRPGGGAATERSPGARS